MDAEKRIGAMSEELVCVWSRMEDLGLCGREASPKVAATLQEVIRLLQGLVAALERRTER